MSLFSFAPRFFSEPRNKNKTVFRRYLTLVVSGNRKSKTPQTSPRIANEKMLIFDSSILRRGLPQASHEIAVAATDITFICRREGASRNWDWGQSVEVLDSDGLPRSKGKIWIPTCTILFSEFHFIDYLLCNLHVYSSFLSLSKMHQFEHNNITSNQLMSVILNSSFPGSHTLFPGDLVLSVKAVGMALKKMSLEEKLSSAKVRKSFL